MPYLWLNTAVTYSQHFELYEALLIARGKKEVSLTTVESHANLWGNKYLGGILTTWPFSKSGAIGSLQGPVTSLAIDFKPYLQHEALILLEQVLSPIKK